MNKELVPATKNQITKSSNAIISVLDNIYNVQLSELVGKLEKPQFPIDGELRNDEICFYQIKTLG